MIIGRLRNRVEVQSKQGGIDDGFGTAPNWTTTESRYAQITEMGAKELETAKQINAEISIKIITRYFMILPSQRLKFGSRIFNILSVISDERHTMTTIMASEMASEEV